MLRSSRPIRWWLGMACLASALVVGCGDSAERNDRSRMKQATVTIKGHTFKVAVASTIEEQRVGLMNVKSDELGQDEGMLFVFRQERPLSFWMKNTITPLDIAFVDSRGRIVKTYTMKPLDTTSHSSVKPARFALEVHAGRLAALGITEGDVAQITGISLKP